MSTQTKIDEILIQMISPKIKEIEERFSKSEGLSNDDINTLLLKSQFNHINHLDEKLNEVTADVASLKLEFTTLKFELKTDNANFRAEIKIEIANLNSKVMTEIGGLKTDMANLKTDNANFNTKIITEIGGIKTEIANMKTEVQSAINKNMQWSIGIITFIITVLKVIDTIWHR